MSRNEIYELRAFGIKKFGRIKLKIMIIKIFSKSNLENKKVRHTFFSSFRTSGAIGAPVMQIFLFVFVAPRPQLYVFFFCFLS